MGLFSLFRKNKQESSSGQGEFLSRSASESATTRSRSSNARKSSRAAKDDANDPVLPEKKRARRRLIGAVALVLAVVIVLPMILDSEPRPLADDIAIQIPSKDGKNAAPVSAPVSAPADDKESRLAKLAANSAVEPKEEFVDPATLAPAGEKPAIAPGMSAMPSGPASAAPAPVEKIEPPKPAPKAEVKAEVKESKTESKASSRTAEHEHKDEHKASKDAKAKPADKVEKSDKSDKSDARALAILEGKSASADKKSAPAASGGKFVIQVAALATQDKIDELRGKLSSAGIKSFTQKVATQAGERTRIRVGPFASRDEADKMRAKINKMGLNATIVPA
jgi:DedD protein